MGSSIGRHNGITLLLLAGFALVLSACASEEAKRQGLDVLRKSEINAPPFDVEDALGEISPQREKISRLEIVAPRAGSLLSSYRVLYGQARGDKIKLGQDFRLIEDMEPAVRDVSGYLFEISPGADKYAVVELKIDASTVLNKEKVCEPFVTTVNLQVQIHEISSDGTKRTEGYESVETDNACTSIFLPFANAVQGPLNDAYSDVFAKALRARNLLN